MPVYVSVKTPVTGEAVLPTKVYRLPLAWAAAHVIPHPVSVCVPVEPIEETAMTYQVFATGVFEAETVREVAVFVVDDRLSKSVAVRGRNPKIVGVRLIPRGDAVSSRTAPTSTWRLVVVLLPSSTP